MIHTKKIWPQYFEKIKQGKKNFEVRLGDFKCKEGDTLILKEWDPKTKEFTGRSIKKRVTYVFNTKDVKFWKKKEIKKYGLLVISIK